MSSFFVKAKIIYKEGDPKDTFVSFSQILKDYGTNISSGNRVDTYIGPSGEYPPGFSGYTNGFLKKDELDWNEYSDFRDLITDPNVSELQFKQSKMIFEELKTQKSNIKGDDDIELYGYYRMIEYVDKTGVTLTQVFDDTGDKRFRRVLAPGVGLYVENRSSILSYYKNNKCYYTFSPFNIGYNYKDSVTNIESLVSNIREQKNKSGTTIATNPVITSLVTLASAEEYNNNGVQKGAYNPLLFILSGGNSIGNYNTTYDSEGNLNNFSYGYGASWVTGETEGYHYVLQMFNYNLKSPYIGEKDATDFWCDFFEGMEEGQPTPPGPSPSGPGGGGGNYDDSSDSIKGFQLPGNQSISTGFTTSYAVTESDLKQISSAMWTTDIIDNIVKYFAGDPYKSIIGISLVPTSGVISGASQNVKIGNVDLGVSATKLTNRYNLISMGSFQLDEYYGDFMDYDPYTRVMIYLPFIGLRQLSVNQIQGSTISVEYCIDLLTGQILAHVEVAKGNLNSILYEFEGNANNQVCVTSNDFSRYTVNMMKGTLNTVVGGASALQNTSMDLPMVEGMGNMLGGMLPGAMTALSSMAHIQRGLGDINVTGSLSSASGWCDIKSCYLILERRKKANSQNFANFYGYESQITEQLSSLSGYTKVREVYLDGVTATDEEKEEIKSLLKNGVIL